MKQVVTTGIILSRINYGEADRIITVLTPDHGKVRLMARGVRKINSKLAGGIELFSISDITYIEGRGEIGTLISSRMRQHYANIVKDLDRVQLGYELIKQLNKATEDHTESEYFDLLARAFAALDDKEISIDLIRLWFQAQLLKLAGHSPNLKTDTAGQPLDAAKTYAFDLEAMTFGFQSGGRLDANAIKFLRLIFSGHPPQALAKVKNTRQVLAVSSTLVQAMLQNHIRL